jgi:cellulose synthase/poly-beta-1,6-N-acetylglucosamine synthase-like glycosyltransferase
MIIILTLTGVLSAIYALLDLSLFRGLRRVGRAEKSKRTPTISILICARNEEKRLPKCLESLLQQKYPGEWTVWIADDRSEDATSSIIQTFCTRYPEQFHSIRIDSLPLGLSPKKHAITQLAQKAGGEIFLLTDADCVVPPGWILGMVENFNPTVDWVSGYSYFPDGNLLLGMQALDFLSHRTVDAGGVGLGIPITACGQNLGYRKTLFEELGGFAGVDHVTSGDDDLLMHKLASKRPQAIQYCVDPSTFVWSASVDTWKAAWEQRKRWASKTVHYSMPALLLLGSVFAYYCMIILGIPLGLAWLAYSSHPLPLALASGALLWKTAWDTLVMAQGIHLFGEQRLWRYYPATALVHIPLIISAVLVGVFGKFTWKDGTTR